MDKFIIYSTVLLCITSVSAYGRLPVDMPKTAVNGDKVTICHAPPGNPDNYQLLTISTNALNAHREHHQDVFAIGGKCPGLETAVASNIDDSEKIEVSGVSGPMSWREITMLNRVIDPIKEAKAAERRLANDSTAVK